MTSIVAFLPCPTSRVRLPPRFPGLGPGILFACLLAMRAAAAEPGDVLILSSDFDLKQVTASGMLETRPVETETARRVLRQALTAALNAHPDLRAIPVPELDTDEQAAVDEHVALLSTIIENVRFMEERNAAGYARKSALGPAAISVRDYSMGAGLNFLAERTGARQALIVTGWHVAPTGGRVALGILLYGMPPPQAGALSVVMADLGTGRLTWFRSTREVYDGVTYALLGQGKGVDDDVVTDPARAEALFRDMLASYQGPGPAQ